MEVIDSMVFVCGSQRVLGLRGRPAGYDSRDERVPGSPASTALHRAHGAWVYFPSCCI